MNRIRTFRSALVALVPLVAIAFGGVALAQTPAATPPSAAGYLAAGRPGTRSNA